MINGKELSRASSSVIGVGLIHELNFKLSKDISWKSWVINQQKLPTGEITLPGGIVPV